MVTTCRPFLIPVLLPHFTKVPKENLVSLLKKFWGCLDDPRCRTNFCPSLAGFTAVSLNGVDSLSPLQKSRRLILCPFYFTLEQWSSYKSISYYWTSTRHRHWTLVLNCFTHLPILLIYINFRFILQRSFVYPSSMYPTHFNPEFYSF